MDLEERGGGGGGGVEERLEVWMIIFSINFHAFVVVMKH